MYFTKEDIEKIKNALLDISKKDTDFEETDIVQSNDTITIVLEGKNKKMTILLLLRQFLEIYSESCLNLTDKYGIYIDSLEEAISLIPSRQRKEGLIITFLANDRKWKLYLFQGNLNQFENTAYWVDIFDINNYIVNSLLADEEDLTSTEKDVNGNSKIKIKNRKYDPSVFSGKGYKLLRKNITERINNDGSIDRINYLSPNEFNDSNTIYEIRYDFTLNNKTVDLLENCVLVFNGGSINDGEIKCNNTLLIGDYSNSSVLFKGTYNSIDKEISANKVLINKNTTEINNLSLKIDSLFISIMNRFSTVDTKISLLETTDSQLDNKRTTGDENLNNRISNLDAKINNNISNDLLKFETVNTAIEQLNNDIEDINTNHGELNLKYGQLSNKIEDINTKYNEVNTNISDLNNKYSDINTLCKKTNTELLNLKSLFYQVESTETAPVSLLSTDLAKIEDLRVVNEATKPELVVLVSNTYYKSFSLKNDLEEKYKLTNTFTYISSSIGNLYRVEPTLKGVESTTDIYKLIKL